MALIAVDGFDTLTPAAELLAKYGKGKGIRRFHTETDQSCALGFRG